MAKVFFVGNGLKTRKYIPVSFEDIFEIMKTNELVAMDTETTVTESILTRELKVVSVGWEIDDTVDMAVFEWDFLTHQQKAMLGEYLVRTTCIIHNASFDYQVFRKYGYTLEKIICTYLGEQILTNGLSSEKGYHGLQSIYLRRFDLDISKAAQLTFGVGPYDDSQIQYAAIDVYKLIQVYREQKAEMISDDIFMKMRAHKGARKTAWWENEFVKCAADMEYNGVFINRPRWYEIEDAVKPTFDKELDQLNAIVVQDFSDELIEENLLTTKHEFDSIWNSSAKKKKLLSKDFPGINSMSAPNLKKYLMEFDPSWPKTINLDKAIVKENLPGKQYKEHPYSTTYDDKYALIKLLIRANAGNREEIHGILDTYAISNHWDFLVEEGWLIPANTLKINWNSPIQRLKVFQFIDPYLEKTGKELIKDIQDKHRLFPHYLAWAEVAYQIKSFGKEFYDKNVDIDGRFRTRFRQILATGRLSSTSPNLLAIPGKEVYRRCFMAREGFSLIGADYDAEEIVIMATLAKETTWLSAINKGWDIHSVNAENVYGDVWHAATEKGCKYASHHKKCECAGHKKLRTAVKTVIFSSAYGGTYIKIAFLLKISEDEAKELLKNFHLRVPKLKEMMDRFGEYVLAKGRIIEPVFGRSRHFDKWKLAKEQNAVVRASLNYPIQSSGGAILKIAAVLMRRWINQNNLQDIVFIILTVHDEFLLECRDDYIELAGEKLAHYMRLAATLAGFTIGADYKSGSDWFKCH